MSRTAHIELRIAGHPVQLQLTVPSGPATRRTMLPVLRQLADAVVEIGVQQAQAQGERVSCTKGCGACCRQLVPITEPEAHALRELVDGMPEPRRTSIMQRMRAVRERLAECDLLDPLLQPDSPEPVMLRELGLRYFQLGIPCPFLEDEACSIHEHRPIACREYLVTSPAEHCAAPSADTVRMVTMPGRVSTAITRMQPGRTAWVPLAIAVEWAGSREEEPAQPARAIVERFFQEFSR
jgi:Fe-S-cluster containining protein